MISYSQVLLICSSLFLSTRSLNQQDTYLNQKDDKDPLRIRDFNQNLIYALGQINIAKASLNLVAPIIVIGNQFDQQYTDEDIQDDQFDDANQNNTLDNQENQQNQDQKNDKEEEANTINELDEKIVDTSPIEIEDMKNFMTKLKEKIEELFNLVKSFEQTENKEYFISYTFDKMREFLNRSRSLMRELKYESHKVYSYFDQIIPKKDQSLKFLRLFNTLKGVDRTFLNLEPNKQKDLNNEKTQMASIIEAKVSDFIKDSLSAKVSIYQIKSFQSMIEQQVKGLDTSLSQVSTQQIQGLFDRFLHFLDILKGQETPVYEQLDQVYKYIETINKHRSDLFDIILEFIKKMQSQTVLTISAHS